MLLSVIGFPVFGQTVMEICRASRHRGYVPEMKHGETYAGAVSPCRVVTSNTCTDQCIAWRSTELTTGRRSRSTRKWGRLRKTGRYLTTPILVVPATRLVPQRIHTRSSPFSRTLDWGGGTSWIGSTNAASVS
jgi:hypothetical protein